MDCFASWQIDWGKFAEIVATSIATLAAAYFGAKFAFDMQVNRENKKRIAENIESANMAVFTIRRFRDLFRSLLEATQKPEHKFDDHYLVMKPFSSFDFERPSFAFERLAFLLNSNENLLFKLAALQNSLSATLDLVKRRSDLHYTEIQPAMEALQSALSIEHVPDNFPELLAEKIGPRLDAVMESVTKQMISGFQEDIEFCTDLANEISKAVVEIYPKNARRRLWASRSSA